MIQYAVEHPILTLFLTTWFLISCRFIHLNGDWKGAIIIPIITTLLFFLGGWKLLTPIIDTPTKLGFGDGNLLNIALLCCIPAIMITGPIALIHYIWYRWNVLYSKTFPNRIPQRESSIDPIIDYFKKKSR